MRAFDSALPIDEALPALTAALRETVLLAMIPKLPLQGEPVTFELERPTPFDKSLIVMAAFLPLILLGGVIRRGSPDLTGPVTERSLELFSADQIGRAHV